MITNYKQPTDDEGKKYESLFFWQFVKIHSSFIWKCSSWQHNEDTRNDTANCTNGVHRKQWVFVVVSVVKLNAKKTTILEVSNKNENISNEIHKTRPCGSFKSYDKMTFIGIWDWMSERTCTWNWDDQWTTFKRMF